MQQGARGADRRHFRAALGKHGCVWLAAIAVAFATSPARADVRTEARTHFRHGMALIAEGHLEEGIAELQEAYDILPHPNALYNIARAYAEAWGYGALIVTNVFGWRSTDPRALRSVRDPVGSENDAAIVRAARASDLVVCAWGNHGTERSEQIRRLLRGIPLHVLQLTGSGQPGHPLYLKKSLRAKPW